MASTIEFEKTTEGNARVKWSNEATSRFVTAPTEAFLSADSAGNMKVLTTQGNFGFRLQDISTINGAPAPATVEETLAILAAEVFKSGGGTATGVQGVTGNLVDNTDPANPIINDPASADISDSTTVGRSVLTAVDAAAARTAIGAGTSNLVLGTTAGTAKVGTYVPTYAEVTGKPATFAPTIGTTGTTAKAGNYTPSLAEVSAVMITITGYNAAETQTLKNVAGVLTWVTDTP